MRDLAQTKVAETASGLFCFRLRSPNCRKNVAGQQAEGASAWFVVKSVDSPCPGIAIFSRTKMAAVLNQSVEFSLGSIFSSDVGEVLIRGGAVRTRPLRVTGTMPGRFQRGRCCVTSRVAGVILLAFSGIIASIPCPGS